MMALANSTTDASAASASPVELEQQFQRIIAEYGDALARFAAGYELDHEGRRDLIQEIYVAVWRSLTVYDSRCSIKTWVYRVAHNTSVKYLLRQKRRALASLKRLEDVDEPKDPRDLLEDLQRELAVQRLSSLIATLKPLDRQIILLYIDGIDADEISEVTGLSPGTVSVKVHRIKHLLGKMFESGSSDGRR